MLRMSEVTTTPSASCTQALSANEVFRSLPANYSITRPILDQYLTLLVDDPVTPYYIRINTMFYCFCWSVTQFVCFILLMLLYTQYLVHLHIIHVYMLELGDEYIFKHNSNLWLRKSMI